MREKCSGESSRFSFCEYYVQFWRVPEEFGRLTPSKKQKEADICTAGTAKISVMGVLVHVTRVPNQIKTQFQWLFGS